jgi:hypothetical protein
MPYGGFSNGSGGAEELDACGLLRMLYRSEDDVLNVLKKSLNRLLACTSTN